MNKILTLLTRNLKEQTAFAHCDIPCGIYDPHNAQMAAHTIIRMTQFLKDIKREDETKAEHDIARVTHVKEKHANILEEELDTLQNDYFKEEHFKEYPQLELLFKDALKFSSKARQGIDMEAAQNTLEKVLEISEIFFKTKNVTLVRVKSVYPTEGEIVTYK
ncbi:MAG: superoxide dismutase, Ni [Candidatus Levybacteria bacterium RIFCSPLOWO2_01_FULL_36_13]|nr:MAG: superoxide dismutase, Ni [Candidatus Levybacteria bacterium RIFCSPHIGHO2_01_FULL_36_15b]OGH34281.1 MAG: superoxide dismutase, Ni [Candidatus Levybacteria bacterium RIFCSPLOWO2_01_FULL_36_13]